MVATRLPSSVPEALSPPSAGASAEGFNFRTGEKSNYPRILGFHPHPFVRLSTLLPSLFPAGEEAAWAPVPGFLGFGFGCVRASSSGAITLFLRPCAAALVPNSVPPSLRLGPSRKRPPSLRQLTCTLEHFLWTEGLLNISSPRFGYECRTALRS